MYVCEHGAPLNFSSIKCIFPSSYTATDRIGVSILKYRFLVHWNWHRSLVRAHDMWMSNLVVFDKLRKKTHKLHWHRRSFTNIKLHTNHSRYGTSSSHVLSPSCCVSPFPSPARLFHSLLVCAIRCQQHRQLCRLVTFLNERSRAFAFVSIWHHSFDASNSVAQTNSLWITHRDVSSGSMHFCHHI